MSYGRATVESCPGGCGHAYTRTDYKRDPPPIPILPQPRWTAIDAASATTVGLDACPVCGILLEDEYQARRSAA